MKLHICLIGNNIICHLSVALFVMRELALIGTSENVEDRTDIPIF